MIYERVAESEPIRQGDIFIGLPRIEMRLGKLPVVLEGPAEEMSWSEVLEEGRDSVTAVVGIVPVTAIVMTQDCDAVSAPQITLCEVRPFKVVERHAKETKSPKSWASVITQHSRINLKWFYLPPDPEFSIPEKMAADFRVTISLLREDLETLRFNRLGRLNYVADEHFRERLSEFFRRYPVDEWYALDDAEMKGYESDHPEAARFSWQSPPAAPLQPSE